MTDTNLIMEPKEKTTTQDDKRYLKRRSNEDEVESVPLISSSSLPLEIESTPSNVVVMDRPSLIKNRILIVASVIMIGIVLIFAEVLPNYDDGTTTEPNTNSIVQGNDVCQDPSRPGLFLEFDFVQDMAKTSNDNMAYCDPQRVETLSSCHCPNPTRGIPRKTRAWEKTFASHLQLVKTTNPNVLFIGDSITEQWAGTQLGRSTPPLASVKALFQEFFNQTEETSNDDVTPIHGLPLAIAGDTSPNLLYRVKQYLQAGIMHDEDPTTSMFQPRIWWQLIGTNDRLITQCSVDAVVAGNIAIVKTLLAGYNDKGKTRDMVIVINSILPSHADTREAWNDINQRLACYASRTDHVEFFNATSYFLEYDQVVHLKDFVHPDTKGYQVWGQGIVDRIHEIFSQDT